MTGIFLHIINMSINASYVILAVFLLRLVIRKAPKWINVALWSIVALRLVCPFFFESVISLIPNAIPISPSIMAEEAPEINSGIPIVDNSANAIIGESSTPSIGDGVNSLQIWIPILSIIWVVGIVVLLIYAAVSYFKVRQRVGTAVLYKDNVYQSDNVVSPFVLGVIRPRIYLPFNINEKNMSYVIAHETHIMRKDHIWKPLGFLILSAYWFNPLVWLAYILLCRDIELACDERVIKVLDCDARADYSEALLACSVNRRIISACPLAFGEVGVKDRVKSVLNYKKTAFWIIVVAIIVCVAVAICFLTNPKDKKDDAPSAEDSGGTEASDGSNPDSESEKRPENLGETDPAKLTDEQIALIEKCPEFFGLDAAYGLDIYVWQMAANSYIFTLLPHDEPISLFPKGVDANDMRHILATYDIDASDIYIIPWNNPASSYLGNNWFSINGENDEAKKAAYVKNVWDLLSEEMVYGTESGTPELVYSDPTLSWVASYYSGIKIVDDVLYDLASGEQIGRLTRKYLSQNELDYKLMEDFVPYEGLGNRIRHSTFISYEVSLTNAHRGVDLYYVIIQSDCTALLVYGHYENDEKTDHLRWIFNVGE